jgi:hypothetical protein
VTVWKNRTHETSGCGTLRRTEHAFCRRWKAASSRRTPKWFVALGRWDEVGGKKQGDTFGGDGALAGKNWRAT